MITFAVRGGGGGGVGMEGEGVVKAFVGGGAAGETVVTDTDLLRSTVCGLFILKDQRRAQRGEVFAMVSRGRPVVASNGDSDAVSAR